MPEHNDEKMKQRFNVPPKAVKELDDLTRELATKYRDKWY